MKHRIQLVLAIAILSWITFITVKYSMGSAAIANMEIVPTATYIEPKQLVDWESVECLALNMYHEARGEGLDGKLAVAHVTMNRVGHRSFPNTVCGVVYQGYTDSYGNPLRNRCHFSWYCDGKSDTPRDTVMWERTQDIALAVLAGRTTDPTQGATHYYNPHKVTPYWRDSFTQVAVVGDHVFMM